MTIKKHGTVEINPDGGVTIRDFVFEGVNLPAATNEVVIWAVNRLTEPRPQLEVAGDWGMAKGDGATDDTDAINAAITAAAKANA